MTLPDAQKLYAVIEGTWPAAAKRALGPWAIRLDSSGSSRVSAATAEQPVRAEDLPHAEAAMRQAGQKPLFMIRQGDTALDDLLDARGYGIKDTTHLYAAPIDALADRRLPPMSRFEVWPPLAIQSEIWLAGGIGRGRMAIMDRARAPKTTILGRLNDQPAGTAYVGSAADCAMIHALEVARPHRRKGLARHMTVAAAVWARAQGLHYLTLVTTRANTGANALYASLGMTLVGQYHYRTLPE